jgi:hypothetical protein
MKKYVRCSCGEIVGEEKLDRIDNKLKSWGFDGGKVYKTIWNGKEARQKIGRSNNMIVPLKNNMYMCKKCFEKAKG